MPVKTYEIFRGLDKKTDEELVQDHNLVVAEDLDMTTKLGSIVSIKDNAETLGGQTFSDVDAMKYWNGALYIQDGTTLYKDTASHKTGLNTEPCSLQELGSYLYFANGTDQHKTDGTTVTRMGIEEPSSAPVAQEQETKYANNPILSEGDPGDWDDSSILSPNVLKDGSTYKLYYGGYDGANHRIGLATSTDLVAWTKHINVIGGDWVLDIGAGAAWDSDSVYNPQVIKEPDGTYTMFYLGWKGVASGLGRATSVDSTIWIRDIANNPVSTEITNVFGCTKVGNTYYLVGFGDPGAGNGVYFWTSHDGINWTVQNSGNKVLETAGGTYYSNGISAPNLIYNSNTGYFIIYIHADDGVDLSIGRAYSTDCVNWTISSDPVIERVAGTWENILSSNSPGVVLTDTNESVVYKGSNGAVEKFGIVYIEPIHDGTYKIKVTYYNSTTGIESAPSDEAEIAVYKRLIKLSSIPVSSDTQVDKRRIYISGGTYGLYYLALEIDDNVTTAINNYQSLGYVGVDTTVVLHDDDDPPSFKYMTSNYRRIIGSTGSNQTAYRSNTGNGEMYDSDNEVPYGEQLNDIYGLVTWNNNTYAFIKNKIAAIIGNTVGIDLYKRETISTKGTISPHALIPTQMGIFFMSQDGINLFNGSTSKKISSLVDPILGTAGYNSSYIEGARAAFHYNKYYFSYPESGQTSNSNTLIFDLEYGIWTVDTNGYKAFAIDPTYDYLYGAKDSKIYTYGNHGTDYKALHIKTKTDHLGVPDRWKTSRRTFITCNPNGQNLQVKIYYDGSLKSTQTLSASALGKLKIDMPRERFRTVQFELTGTASTSRQEIKNIIVEFEV